MGNWIIHIVGETIDDDLAPAISKFVKEVQGLSHKVRQVRLTTDAGEKIIHVTQEVEKVADTATKDVSDGDPALAPEADAVDKVVDEGATEVDKGVTDIETKEGTPLPTSLPTPEPVSEEATTVDPPLAGASSSDSKAISSAVPTGSTPPTAIPTVQ